MYRFCSLLVISIAACTDAGAAAPGGDHALAQGRGPALVQDGAGGAGEGGAGGFGPGDGPYVCAPDGPYASAPEGTPECGSGAACDGDADCAIYPGNYCRADVCAYLGCLRGRCSLTKVMGQPCTRDGECVSGVCLCDDAGPQDSCLCAPGFGGPHFP